MSMQRKFMLAVLALMFSVAGVAYAASEHDGHMMHEGGKASMAMEMSKGSIKKINKEAEKITIAHGPLENLAMPAMTMTFKVVDKSWLDSFKVGDDVRFFPEHRSDGYTVVKMEKAD